MVQLRVSLGVSYPLTKSSGNVVPVTVEVRQNEFMHDMAVIRYSGVTPASAAFKSGNPVRVTYGYRGQQLAEFCGYVLWAKTRRGSSGETRRVVYTDVVAMGASRVMRQAAHRVHTSATVNQIIRTVSRDYHFDILRSNLPEKWGRLVNPGKSDFSHLMSVAKRKGHIFYVHNATVCMYDPIDYIVKHRASWPVLLHRQGMMVGDILAYDGVLSDDGEGIVGPVGTQHLGYVDPITGTAAEAANTGDCSPHADDIWDSAPFDVWVDDEPVEDANEAAMVTEGAALNSRWRHTMKVTAYGNQRVHQGTGVVLNGVADNVNGLWYVKSTKHSLERTDHPGEFIYRMDLALLRDSRTLKTVPLPVTLPVRREVAVTGMTAAARKAAGLGSLAVFDSPQTGPVIKKGIWVSNKPLREVLA